MYSQGQQMIHTWGIPQENPRSSWERYPGPRNESNDLREGSEEERLPGKIDLEQPAARIAWWCSKGRRRQCRPARFGRMCGVARG
jgi:hypothetical protein